MSGYSHPSDLDHLADLQSAAPREFKAWQRLDAIVGLQDGAIPRKYRELIALAVAHTTQCAYCLDVHTKGAIAAGVTKNEVAEAALIAAALRSGAAGAHAAMTMRLFDQHSAHSEG